LSFAASPLNELSGGQRQLAVLAQSLVRDPKILLLDEPTSALDLRHQVEVMTVLHAIARDDGCIVVLVLHDLALAAKWADRFVVLQDGRVAASGLTPEVLTPDVVRAIYGVEAEIRWTGTRGPQINILGLACANRTAD
jgi:iron complex transport system ATP-binding protein